MYKQYTCAPAQLASLAHNFLEPPCMFMVEKKNNQSLAHAQPGAARAFFLRKKLLSSWNRPVCLWLRGKSHGSLEPPCMFVVEKKTG
jgi:hypothetical protein